VFIRGANTNQSIVLIDGQRIGSATSGSAALSRIPLDQIERIEILRGPASSLYGADAIGGVIQIFTRRGEGPCRVNASTGYGSLPHDRYQRRHCRAARNWFPTAFRQVIRIPTASTPSTTRKPVLQP
jgi:outer membrane cobalamin receptor